MSAGILAINMHRLVLVFLSALALAVSVFGNGAPPAKIRIGDELTVYVFGESGQDSDSALTKQSGIQMSGGYVVQSDGAIYIPRLGRLEVSGETVETAGKALIKKLKSIYRDPFATLSIKRQRQQEIFVVAAGSSNTTAKGVVELQPETDLRAVYAQAGIEKEADLLNVSVFRGGKKIVTESAADLTNGRSGAWNGPLESDDIVVIEPRPYIRVWVLGIVKSPGRIMLAEGDDVYKAIAQAGDVTSAPAPTLNQPSILRSEMTVTVRRGPKLTRLPLIPDNSRAPFALEDGDTISVQPPAQVRVLFSGESKVTGEGVFNQGTTLGAALNANGITPNGSLRRVLLFRQGVATVQDVSPSADGHTANLGPELEQGDVVFVPKNERVFYVFGEVNKVGRYPLEDNRIYRLSDAIAISGGLTANGSNRHVSVGRRGPDGKIIVTEYHLDQYLKDGSLAANPVLEPDDMVYVDHPKGLTLTAVTQAITAALFLESIRNL
jgi:protein involved in polysaccharide export with SLBB domain